MTENEKQERQIRSKIIAGMHGAAKRFENLANKLEYFAPDVTVWDIKGACEMADQVAFWATYEWARALEALAAPPPTELTANAPLLDVLADLPDAIKNQASEVEEPF